MKDKNLRSGRQPEVAGVGQAGDGHVEMGLVKLVGQEEQRSVQRASQVGAQLTGSLDSGVFSKTLTGL